MYPYSVVGTIKLEISIYFQNQDIFISVVSKMNTPRRSDFLIIKFSEICSLQKSIYKVIHQAYSPHFPFNNEFIQILIIGIIKYTQILLF